jgi:ribosomal protein L24E
MGSHAINEEDVIQRLLAINAKYEAQWAADLAALRVLVAEEESLPLRMGDLFLTLKERWGGKLPDLAKEAGVSPHTARQRARIAARFPAGCVLRTLALPFSIYRLLAPLPDPEPWAERARTLQATGELHVRTFARELVDAGLRRPRTPRPARCLHCGSEIAEGADCVYVRAAGRAGRLCGTPCAAAYFTNPRPTPSAAAPTPVHPQPTLPRRTTLHLTWEDPESHLRSPQPKIQNPKSRIQNRDEEERLLALLSAEKEAGVGRLLSQCFGVALRPSPASASPPSPRPPWGRPRET